MKKVISVLLSMIMALSLVTAVSASGLTTADALTVLRAAAGMIELTAEQKTNLGISGTPSTADALRILRVAAGLSTEQASVVGTWKISDESIKEYIDFMLGVNWLFAQRVSECTCGCDGQDRRNASCTTVNEIIAEETARLQPVRQEFKEDGTWVRTEWNYEFVIPSDTVRYIQDGLRILTPDIETYIPAPDDWWLLHWIYEEEIAHPNKISPCGTMLYIFNTHGYNTARMAGYIIYVRA
ncbi:MAG: hypothetical protein FWD48_08370 [Oscillospiraceae bacterium]|nr:hypothetical protein [Oscillospiraceae bacterium]